MGSPTYTLLKNLVRPGKPQDKSLEELFTLLKNHYEPKVIVIAERFRYYKRQQKEGETIAVYVSELRRLAKNCQFGDQLSIALRDQFVCGLFQESIQQKLLAESDLTLDKPLQIAQAAEMARLETQTLRGETTHHTKQSTETAFAVKKTTTAGRSQSGRIVLQARYATDAMRVDMNRPSANSRIILVIIASLKAILSRHAERKALRAKPTRLVAVARPKLRLLTRSKKKKSA